MVGGHLAMSRSTGNWFRGGPDLLTSRLDSLQIVIAPFEAHGP